jgi:hypothetical protein
MEVHTWRDDGAPESWTEVLAKLKQFERSAQSLAQTKESKSLSQEEQDTLYASHDHLVELASERLPTQAALDVEAALFDQVFVEAVLLPMLFSEPARMRLHSMQQSCGNLSTMNFTNAPWWRLPLCSLKCWLMWWNINS